MLRWPKLLPTPCKLPVLETERRLSLAPHECGFIPLFLQSIDYLLPAVARRLLLSVLGYPDPILNNVKLTSPCIVPCQRFTQSASVESQEADAPGVSPMSKKGPPPGEQEKRRTTAKVNNIMT